MIQLFHIKQSYLFFKEKRLNGKSIYWIKIIKKLYKRRRLYKVEGVVNCWEDLKENMVLFYLEQRIVILHIALMRG